MTNENLDYIKLHTAKIEFGVVLSLGPDRTEGQIGVGETGQPITDKVTFNPAAHRRVCITGDNELLWLPGSQDIPTVRRGRRIAFERSVDSEGNAFATLWTFGHEYLHVFALARTAERYVIKYEDGDDNREQWVGTYCDEFDRRVDIAGQFPTRPTDQHTLWKYNGNGKAVSVRRLTSVEPSWLQKFGFAQALA